MRLPEQRRADTTPPGFFPQWPGRVAALPWDKADELRPHGRDGDPDIDAENLEMKGPVDRRSTCQFITLEPRTLIRESRRTGVAFSRSPDSPNSTLADAGGSPWIVRLNLARGARSVVQLAGGSSAIARCVFARTFLRGLPFWRMFMGGAHPARQVVVVTLVSGSRCRCAILRIILKADTHHPGNATLGERQRHTTVYI
jgi:hypothetical protein